MKGDVYTGFSGPHLELIASAERAARRIAPLWPLEATVAVNPYLGMADQDLAQAGARLERVAGARAAMPRKWYADKIATGTLTEADLEAALAVAPAGAPADVTALRAALDAADPARQALPTVAALVAEATGTDWPEFLADRIGAWAGGYFDAGQALWMAVPGQGAFDSWLVFAKRDLSPEIAGLDGFAAEMAAQPTPARHAVSLACDTLGLNVDAAETYFHQLLVELGGWAQLARLRHWQAEQAGGLDTTLTDLLAIRLIWDAALLSRHAEQVGARWSDVVAAHAAPETPGDAHVIDAILQEAAERAAQRQLAQVLGAAPAHASLDRPALQAAFCIDVRSEVFRRALEAQGDGIATLGFAGFFGLGVAHRGPQSDVVENRLPVLLKPGLVTSGRATDDGARRIAARARRAWGRFRQAAVSSFAFVEASGPLYAGKLIRDALGLAAHAPSHDPMPQLDGDVPLAARVTAATTILRAMSLTQGFAPLVLLVGHGANVTNNPHASALHCGACGGYSGEVNARLLAGLLNDAEVRAGLAEAGIDVPTDTLFVAGLHDTTTDAVTLYSGDAPATDHEVALQQARRWLRAAGRLARAERALRLPGAHSDADVTARARNWAETRPEWALAGCRAFIAAPRAVTRGKGLAGQAFLHDYAAGADDGYKVLELILTAPVVVASWISLQYYGSVTAPRIFGAGDKLLHNVTGGVGVLEGTGGILRGGLPWQSVHDGTDFAHDPLRLSVCLAAPEAAVSDILGRHPDVRALFDNRWLHLFLLDAQGRMVRRYTGDLTWEDMDGPRGVTRAAA